MLDDMFAFIDPIANLTEENLTQFIAQAEAFFTEQRAAGRSVRQLTENDYKEMWMLRYRQHLGNISFLELLDKYEEILDLPPHTRASE